jgi:hypothetical protein
MRFWNVLVAVVLSTTIWTAEARAEGQSIELSLQLPASPSTRPPVARSIELGLYEIPDFLVHPLHALRDTLSVGTLLPSREVVHLELLPIAAAPVLPLADAAPAPIAPLLEPVRLLADLLVTRASELLATSNMDINVGDRVEEHYTPLHGLAGDIQRGQYLRTDDVTGRQFHFDLRLVIAWRPNDTIRLEAGYGVAYLTGAGRTDVGVTGPGTDHAAVYVIHGPCAAVNFDF